MEKEKRISSKLKSEYWERTHKYDIQSPKAFEEVYAIDASNGDKLCNNAINEEIRIIKEAVRVHEGSPKQFITPADILYGNQSVVNNSSKL